MGLNSSPGVKSYSLVEQGAGNGWSSYGLFDGDGTDNNDKADNKI